MMKKAALLFAFAGSLLVPVRVAADPIYLKSLRYIRMDAGSTGDAERLIVEASENDPFDASRRLSHGDATGTASQSSRLTPAGIFADGTASTQQGLHSLAAANSFLRVNFALLTTHQYSIEGIVNQPARRAGLFFPDLVTLQSNDTNRFKFRTDSNGSFNQTGILRPGSYALNIAIESDATLFGPGSSFETALRLTEGMPTPEPSSLLLLIGAAAATTAHRWRRTRTSSDASPCTACRRRRS